MRSVLLSAAMLVLAAGRVSGFGLLIPDDKKLPPLAMVYHRVNVAIEDQVAVTTVEQAFRNHTDRPLEATYIFPVPRGASVNKFTMFVDGKEVGGEMVEAAKARQIYTDIVRRTQDPGLLEYMGQNLLRLRVFPIAAEGRPEGHGAVHVHRPHRTTAWSNTSIRSRPTAGPTPRCRTSRSSSRSRASTRC